MVRFDIYKMENTEKQSHGQATFFLNEFDFIIDKQEMKHIYDDGTEVVQMCRVFA